MKMHAGWQTDRYRSVCQPRGPPVLSNVYSPETHSYTVSDNRFEVVDDGNGNQQLKFSKTVLRWIAKPRMARCLSP